MRLRSLSVLIGHIRATGIDQFIIRPGRGEPGIVFFLFILPFKFPIILIISHFILIGFLFALIEVETFTHKLLLLNIQPTKQNDEKLYLQPLKH